MQRKTSRSSLIVHLKGKQLFNNLKEKLHNNHTPSWLSVILYNFDISYLLI